MNTKIAGLAAVLVLIGGSIWYLESMKVHPATGSGGAGTTLGLSASTTTTSATAFGPAPAGLSLASIAASDKKTGDEAAIEIEDPTGFVNATSGFKLADLIGKKVILLDFWTYSCINCIRTLPYLTSWYEKYKDQGLVVVGIHTPEFDFEKDIKNVEAATKQYGIKYPVILDSKYGTWHAYNNLYWPHEYLIDIAGYIVHDHIGEGGYDETEGLIQKLLAERAQALGNTTSTVAAGMVKVVPPDLTGIGSPETYFGAARNEFLANGTSYAKGPQTLQEPSAVFPNQLYLAGTWDFDDQFATNRTPGAKIIYKYRSGKVYFVASGAAQGTTVEVLQDGKPITSAAAGSDVHNGKVTITGSRLYSIINNPDGPGEHTLELIVDPPGLQAFTFTFG